MIKWHHFQTGNPLCIHYNCFCSNWVRILDFIGIFPVGSVIEEAWPWYLKCSRSQARHINKMKQCYFDSLECYKHGNACMYPAVCRVLVRFAISWNCPSHVISMFVNKSTWVILLTVVTQWWLVDAGLVWHNLTLCFLSVLLLWHLWNFSMCQCSMADVITVLIEEI